MDNVLRGSIKHTTGGLVAFLRKELVGHSHLNVIRLAREQQKRFVLCLPSEAGQRPVIGTPVGRSADMRIGVPGDPPLSVAGCIRIHVGEDFHIGDCLNEPATEHRRRDAEDDIGVSTLSGLRIPGGKEVGLSDRAARRVASTGDGEDCMDSAVGTTIRILFETYLTDGTVLRDEPGDRVSPTIQGRDRNQRIPRRARSSNCRLGMTSRALV